MAWDDLASCRYTDPEAFFPEQCGITKETHAVSRVCADCPIMYECRFMGLAEDDGIWGNSSPSERKIIRRYFKKMSGEIDAFRPHLEATMRTHRTGYDFRLTLLLAGYSKGQINALYGQTSGDRFAELKAEEHRGLRVS